MYVCVRPLADGASSLTGEEDLCRFLQRLLCPATAVPFVRRIHVPYFGRCPHRMRFLIHFRCCCRTLFHLPHRYKTSLLYSSYIVRYTFHCLCVASYSTSSRSHTTTIQLVPLLEPTTTITRTSTTYATVKISLVRE